MSSPLRVLSLLSASTEIVHRLGCSNLLVGRSHGCDDPPLATILPVATAPKVDPNANSNDLDEAVRAQSATGGAIYRINGELVKRLRPDVIVTQEQCRICAVTPEDVAIACEKLPAETTLVTIKPVTLDDVYDDVLTIAIALGVPERGVRLVQWMKDRLSSLSSLVMTLDAPTPRPRVVHVEWLAPLMGSGYWIAECVEAAGCEMLHGHRGGHSRTLESLSELECADVLVIAPCGFGIERTYVELVEIGILNSEVWQALPAVRAGRVGVADGNLYFNRSSCGVVDSAEIVAEVAHAELRGLFGHHGRRWVRLSELEAFCSREDAPNPMKHVVLADEIKQCMPTAEIEYMDKQEYISVDPDLELVNRPCKGIAKEAHVHLQIKRLRAGDFVGAFALNSKGNQTRLGGVIEFESVVKSNASFAALADVNNDYECVDIEGGGRTVAVSLRTRQGDEINFVYDLSVTADGFATDGVRIRC